MNRYPRPFALTMVVAASLLFIGSVVVIAGDPSQFGPWLTAGAMLLIVVIFAPSLRRDRND
ncbi:hypothetical protein HDC34_002352 [Pseudoclavibacter sp. JAI123]|uniref:hypothetical protein n=1 Tax=Pseudoclavibacter sp. JAI123 TaxID=2723065 RepID=UPI0015CEBE11|nr:hypothetical protein [Pseudoclavibacter sp. JAI123]NYF14058.1 hypothetical protein [Pseudoclavibacter sp. JAI123]